MEDWIFCTLYPRNMEDNRQDGSKYSHSMYRRDRQNADCRSEADKIKFNASCTYVQILIT
jgi:hypothetical protein